MLGFVRREERPTLAPSAKEFFSDPPWKALPTEVVKE